MKVSRIISLLLVTILLFGFLTQVAFAAPNSDNHEHHDYESHKDDPRYQKALKEKIAEVRTKGGLTFEGKEELLKWISSLPALQASLLMEQTDDLAEDALYIVWPSPSTTKSAQGEVVADQGYVLESTMYCPICGFFVSYLIGKLLDAFWTSYYRAYSEWYKWYYDNLDHLLDEDWSTISSTCPDCGPEGHPQYVSNTSTSITWYCSRCMRSWSDFCPF